MSASDVSAILVVSGCAPGRWSRRATAGLCGVPRAAPSALADLLLGFGRELVEPGADFGCGRGLAAGDQIAQDLLDHVVVARLLEIGLDYGLGVAIGRRPAQTQPVGDPQAEQLVAPRGHLERQLLLILVLRLGAFGAVVPARH